MSSWAGTGGQFVGASPVEGDGQTGIGYFGTKLGVVWAAQNFREVNRTKCGLYESNTQEFSLHSSLSLVLSACFVSAAAFGQTSSHPASLHKPNGPLVAGSANDAKATQ